MALATHTGGCHCGAVRYSVELDLTADALVCDCSMCGKGGAMMMFTSPEQFTLEQGEDKLADYQFNKHNIHHVFCTGCGIKPFARGKTPDGKPMVMINVRCVDGVNVFEQPTKQFNGKAH